MARSERASNSSSRRASSKTRWYGRRKTAWRATASSRERADAARDRERGRQPPLDLPQMAANHLPAAGATSSAASLGVSARTSAARSESVTSISWPTAEMTGIREAAIARTTGFLVERPKVFQAAAAAGDDQAVDGPGAGG